MSSNAYQLLGFAVWRAGKWYLRKRLPSRGKIALGGLAGVAVAGAGVVLVRRLSA